MNLTIYSKEITWRKFYPNQYLKVYSSNIYFPVSEDVRNEFSVTYNQSKNKDVSEQLVTFMDVIRYLHSEYDFDCVIPIPNSDNSLSPTMKTFCEQITNQLGIDVQQCFRWCKPIQKRTGNDSVVSYTKRFEITNGNLELTSEISAQKILLIDDLKTTGITLMEANKILSQVKGTQLITAATIGFMRDNQGEYDEQRISI